MNRKITVALGGVSLAVALAGCGQYKISTPQGPATCSVGTSGAACAANGATYSVIPGGGSARATFKNTPPVASPPPQPTATVTATVTAPAPDVTPTVTVTPTTDAVVQQCLPDPSEAVLKQMAIDQSFDLQIAQCLNVSNPQGLAQQLQDSAIIAYETGEGNSQAGVQVWVASSGDVPCPDGQRVHSVTDLYHQYQ